MRMLRRYPWIIPTLIFSFLIVAGAATHPLSGDEPDTAMFARNILKFGVPTAWDGTNLAITNLVVGKDFLNHVHPWLPYYLVAMFFRLFGESVWAARFPFILFSIAGIPIFYHFALSITKKKEVSLLATMAFVLCVPYILYAYQARYYAIVTFAGLVMAFSSFHFRDRLWARVSFIAAATLFFHSNYAVFAPFWLSLFVADVAYFLFERIERKKLAEFILWYMGLGIITALFTLPWFFVLRPDEGRIFTAPEQIKTISIYIETYLRALSVYSRNGAFPLVFVFFLVLVVILRFFQKKPFSDLLFPFGLAFFFLFLMSLLEVTLRLDVGLTQNRYTMVIFPFFILGSITLIADLSVYGKRVVTVVFLLYLLTNVLSLERPRSFFLEFTRETVRPYDTADHVVAQYLLTHASRGETVFSSIEYPLGLLYFVGDKLRFVNRVNRRDLRFATLPRYVYDVEDPPQWVVQYGRLEPVESFTRIFPPGNLETDYEKIMLPVSIIEPFARPEIDFHAFSLPTPCDENRVVVYRRKLPAL